MSVSGSILRAPLLWLLLPFMAGIALADAFPVNARWIPACTLAAAGLGGLAAWLGPRTSRLARGGWIACIGVSGAMCGYDCLLAHSPEEAFTIAVPREAVATLEIEHVFPASPKKKSISGLARIVTADHLVAGAIRHEVYFSAIRKISLQPVESGQYRVRGVLQSRPTDGKLPGFERHLDSLGIRLTLTRAQIIREERAPGWFKRFCNRTRERMKEILRRGIEKYPDVCAIYQGMLLGEKAVLDPEQESAFQHSGTFHIFVIAGLHIGVVAVSIRSLLLLLRVPARPAAVICLGLLWLHVQITGAGLPAQRAFFMIAFLQAGRLFRLPVNPLASLTAAACFVLLLDPRQLFTAGFQMSFAVVTSLVAMGAPLATRLQAAWRPWRDLPEANWKWRQRLVTAGGGHVLGAMAISWSAFVASVPSSIGYFGVLSPGSLLANLAVVPLAMLIIAAGTASLFSGLAHLGAISALFNHAAALLIKLMSWLVLRGVQLPGGYFPAEFSRPWMAPAGLILVVTAILTGSSFGWRRTAGGYLLPVLALVVVVFLGVKFGGGPQSSHP
jgi:competence protein ComEC